MTGSESAILLTCPTGTTAKLLAHGGQTVSWCPAGHGETLYLSPSASFAAGAAIRGGIPVCFPQFSGEGTLPKHGFARNNQWQQTTSPATTDTFQTATMQLSETADTLALWPHEFRCELTLTISGNRLVSTLSVTNTGNEPFTFAAALHTYLAVDGVTGAKVHGLEGAHYRDAADGGRPKRQDDQPIHFGEEVDRVYADAPGPLALRAPEREIIVTQDGFADTVVWNPGPVVGGRIADLDEGGWTRFVCIEAGVIENHIALAPGAFWQASQTLERTR